MNDLTVGAPASDLVRRLRWTSKSRPARIAGGISRERKREQYFVLLVVGHLETVVEVTEIGVDEGSVSDSCQRGLGVVFIEDSNRISGSRLVTEIEAVRASAA